MNDDNRALVEISRAQQALERANDIHEIIDLRDKMMAMQLLANAKGFKEAAQEAKVYQLKAERKAGAWLAENVKPGNPQLYQDGTIDTTLPDGIDRKESSRWQLEASLPEDVFNEWVDESLATGREITAKAIQYLAKEHQQKEKREELRQNAGPQQGEQYRLIHADFRNCLDIQSDAIITDPPYPREYLPLYGDLATYAREVVKPGGLVVVMVGQSYLPEILALMCVPLVYHWTLAYLTPGGQSPQIWQRKVNTFWKPVLVFTNGEYTGDWFGDVLKSAVNDNDKRFHDWGQSESGMNDIIDRFTQPGQTILDPFCGGGTTGIAAIAQGRKFIGIDNSLEAIEIASGRLTSC